RPIAGIRRLEGVEIGKADRAVSRTIDFLACLARLFLAHAVHADPNRNLPRLHAESSGVSQMILASGSQGWNANNIHMERIGMGSMIELTASDGHKLGAYK